MVPDNDLTIIITLKDRTPFTFRWLAYANTVRIPFKILFADGGKDQTVTKVLLDKSNYPNVNYEYIRYPQDRSYSDYYAKVVDTLAYVRTPFVVIGDNDDFFIADGLRRSIDFMRANPDYSACRGEIGSFIVNLSSGAGAFDGVYGKGERFHRLYHIESIVCESALSRVQNHFNAYVPTYYDVHRTEQLKRCFEILRATDLKDVFLAEFLTSFLTAAIGKLKREKGLYLLRQLNTPETVAKEERKKNDPFDRLLLESWSDDFMKFVNAIAEEISNRDRDISSSDVAPLIKKEYRKYIGPNIIRTLSKDQKRGVAESHSPAKKVIMKADSILKRVSKRLSGRKTSDSLLDVPEYACEIESICTVLASQPRIF